VYRQISQYWDICLYRGELSYEWLKTGQGEMWRRKEKIEEELQKRRKELLKRRIEETLEFLKKFERIPIVKRVGIGFPENPADIESVGWVLVSKETFQKGGKFAVEVRGDSMKPTLHDGDFVVFMPYVGNGSDIPSEKLVVVRNFDGQLFIRRFMNIDGLRMLTSDNPKYAPIFLYQPEAEDLRIVGIGVEAIKRIEL
jgi:phage repressor protein C with HTH and peptisase S24 domain